MSLILDINDSIPVLPPPNGLAVNDDVRLTANDGKGDHLPDPGVEGLFFCVVLVGVERVETDVVVRQLGSDLGKKANEQICASEREGSAEGADGVVGGSGGTYPRLERLSLFQRQRVRLSNDRHNVDHLRQLLHDRHVDLFHPSTAKGVSLLATEGVGNVGGGDVQA